VAAGKLLNLVVSRHMQIRAANPSDARAIAELHAAVGETHIVKHSATPISLVMWSQSGSAFGRSDYYTHRGISMSCLAHFE
jgi:hypothetical protein